MNNDLLLDETFTVRGGETGRLDLCVCKRFAQLTRSFAQRLIAEGFVTVNGRACRPGEKLKEGDTVRVRVPRPREMRAVAQDIPLRIVYEDEDIAVVDKPQGMVVHPAAGNRDHTLVNALLFHIGGLSGINGTLRPGIVHRIDKDTSGLIAVAKNDRAHMSLAGQIRDKTAYRVYLAIVHGRVKQDEGVVRAPIARDKKNRKKMAVAPGGREAVTHFKVLERFDGYTLVEARLETGRTHQIRVHMRHIGHPVAGDRTYGPAKTIGESGQLLHAHKLGLVHPSTGERMLFESPLPGEFLRVLERLRMAHAEGP